MESKPNSSYDDFFRATEISTPSICVSNGRVSCVAGDLVFSPNSSKLVSMPSQPRGSRIQPVDPRHERASEECFSPRWWSLDAAHLAFIPLKPDYTAFPFDILNDGSFEYNRSKYRTSGFTNVKKLLRVYRLEWDLVNFVHALKMFYKIPRLEPLLKGTAATFRCHEQIRDLKHEYERTKRWFSVHLGIISFFIAAALAMDGDSPASFNPNWLMHRELHRLFNQDFLSGIFTTAGNFSGYLPRVGIFLDILNPPAHQPSVDFFVKYGVPVWYPWGTAEQKAAETRPEIRRLAPLPSQLQAATTTLTKVPQQAFLRSPASYTTFSSSPFHQVESSPMFPVLDSPMSPDPRTLLGIISSPSSPPATSPSDNLPWIAHFQERQRAINALLRNETPQQRQSRLSRAANPPVGKKTTVYEWTKDDDTGRWSRQNVPKSDNEDVLLNAYYASAQKRYDPVHNVWDCCVAWGTATCEEEEKQKDDERERSLCERYENGELYGEDDDDDDGLFDLLSVPNPDYERLQSPPPLLISNKLDHSTFCAQPTTSHSTPRPLNDWPEGPSASSSSHPPHLPRSLPSRSADPKPIHKSLTTSSSLGEDSDSIPEIFDIDQQHTTEYLFEHFGFVVPDPLPHFHPNKTVRNDITKDASRLAAIAGQKKLPEVFTSSTLILYCLDFVDGLKKNFAPPSSLHDLAPANRLYFATHNQRLPFLRRCGSTYFMLELPADKTFAKWRITLTDAAATLFVCRLPDNLNDIEICRILLQRGVRFFTFLQLPSNPKKDLLPILPPIRLTGYNFTKNDYAAYKDQRSAMLRNSRIRRAALKNGGILWRLVVSDVGFEEVYAGPTTATTYQGRGLYVENTSSSDIYGDDDLLPGEADVLCGLVYRVVHSSGQREELSWWPRPSLWMVIIGSTDWTFHLETKFETRAKELKGDNPQPLNATQWRERLRLSSFVRHAYSENKASSSKFLNQQLPSS